MNCCPWCHGSIRKTLEGPVTQPEMNGAILERACDLGAES